MEDARVVQRCMALDALIVMILLVQPALMMDAVEKED